MQPWQHWRRIGDRTEESFKARLVPRRAFHDSVRTCAVAVSGPVEAVFRGTWLTATRRWIEGKYLLSDLSLE
jgi:hypothetical protein